MKVFLLLSCLALSVCADRVKRVVGGEKAAIPQPIPNLSQGNGNSNSQQGNVNSNSGSSKIDNEKSPTKTTVKEPSQMGSSEESSTKPTSGESGGSQNAVSIYEEDRISKISGVREKEGYIAFKGIPYAEPPLGRNRFQRPILAYLQGKIEAFDYGSPCVQLLPDNSSMTGSEDCLYLNVYTPSVYSRNASGLPVLFWIHGGGFMRGSGNQYGVKDLVKKNIVVVTMNYRLGTLGFLGSSEKQMAGNAALFDIRAAFEWTRRYITYFGGNPRRIFTAGQGSGASVAMLLAQSDFTSGFIQGVLAMSGTGISSTAVDYAPDNTSQFISQTTQCRNLKPLSTVRCLQSCELKAILNVQQMLEGERIGNGGFVNGVSKLLSAGPVVEGKNDGRFLSYFLTSNPLDALKNKAIAKKIPLLMGTTKSETGKAVTGKFRSDVERRLKIPEFLNKILPLSLVDNNVGLFTNGAVNKLIKGLFSQDKYLSFITSTLSKELTEFQKVIETTTDALFNLPAATTSTLWDGESFFYSFQYQSEHPVENSFLEGSTLHAPNLQTTEKSPGHGDDLLYLFEQYSLEGKLIPESALKDQKDRKVKELFVNIITDFLKTGKPHLPQAKEEWRSFKEDNTYAIISDKPKIEKKFRFCQIALWGGFVDKLTDPFCNLPGIQDVLKVLPTDLLNGGLLSNPLKNLLPTGNLLPTDHVSHVGNAAGSLTGGSGTPLPILGNSLLGSGTGGKRQSTTPGKPKIKPTAKPTGQLHVHLPSIG